uniref:Small ribosomal subunit protein uS3c n=1 Tax=Rhododendron shanii TaxID=2172050 RepID=A0A8K1SFE8_9ERIC|nr:ribosomal protein S3 [Rhododendron shanii]
MGQKINPLGFRLGTTQNHHSCWFEQPKNYSEGLIEDQNIRDYIEDFVQENIQKNRRIASSLSGITRIKILKGTDLTEVQISLAFPKLLKEIPMEELQTNLQKKIDCLLNRKINIAITTIAKPYRNPIILAQYIAGQLEHRVPFRKAMKRAIAKAKKEKIKGIRVQIAGRLGGKDIARVEWIRKGRVPLQTIRAKIDYCSYPVRTIYGVLGIKIWIFRGKKKKKKPFLRNKNILKNSVS